MKSKIYYGWWIVVAGSLLSIINGSIFTAGFTAFVNPIVATYGWTYAQVSLGSSIRTVESGAFNPLMGMAVDRWPAKRLALFGILLLGPGIILLSRANNLFMFYTSFVITGIGSSMATSMVPTTLIARWFRKDLGKATGLLSAGVGIGGAFVPMMSKMIDIYGYQTVLV